MNKNYSYQTTMYGSMLAQMGVFLVLYTSLCMCILPISSLYILQMPYIYCKPLKSICFILCILFVYAFCMYITHEHVLFNVK